MKCELILKFVTSNFFLVYASCIVMRTFVKQYFPFKYNNFLLLQGMSPFEHIFILQQAEHTVTYFHFGNNMMTIGILL